MEIEIISGYKSRKRVEFSGSIFVCSPYFVITGNCNISETNSRFTKIKPASKDVIFTYVKENSSTITRDHISSFIYELNINLSDEKEKEYRDELYNLVKKDGFCSLESFRASKAFTVLEIEQKCEFFRVDFEIPLMIAFAHQMQIRKLPSKQLKDLYKKLMTMPWMLCFEKQTKSVYHLEEMTYENLKKFRVDYYKKKIPPLFMTAVRLYTFIKKCRKNGNELFNVKTIFDQYYNHPKWNRIAYENMDDKYKRPAIDFLSYNALQYVDDDKTLLAFERDVRYNSELRRSLMRLDMEGEKPPKERDNHAVPVKPSPKLTEEQLRVIRHVYRNKITLLEGGPGTGKTEVLVALMAAFCNDMVVTFVGMMVDSLQKRFGNRVETAHTIHHIIFKNRYNEAAQEKWLSKFELLIIDEGSNVDIKLLSELIECVPSIKRFIVVGDLGQIYPIKPGSPFADLKTMFPQHAFQLTTNKRVEHSARFLADAASFIRNGESDKIVFNEHDCLTLVERPTTQDGIYNLLKDAIHNTFNVTCVDDIMDFQIVILRNREKDDLNNMVEKILIHDKILTQSQNTRFIGGTSYFKGKKVVFLCNVNPKKSTDPQIMMYDPVKNGELGQILKIQNHDKGCVFHLTNGKRILVGKDNAHEGVVHPFQVSSGYVTTCNKAQGSEWNNILFWIYDKFNTKFTREFPYVAISRAKKKCVVVARDKKEFNSLCQYKARDRDTLLKYYLQKDPTILAKFENTEDIVVQNDPLKLKLLSREKKAVPVMPKFDDSKKTTKKDKYW
jgi:DNA replication protein DnaC